MMEKIENDDKTLLISSKKEIENFVKDITRMELTIPFSILEDAIKIFESMGCGYHDIKIVAYYSLSEKGFFLIAKDGNFGIELKELKEQKE